jgi:hypothetical protein
VRLGSRFLVPSCSIPLLSQAQHHEVTWECALIYYSSDSGKLSFDTQVDPDLLFESMAQERRGYEAGFSSASSSQYKIRKSYIVRS